MQSWRKRRLRGTKLRSVFHPQLNGPWSAVPAGNSPPTTAPRLKRKNTKSFSIPSFFDVKFDFFLPFTLDFVIPTNNFLPWNFVLNWNFWNERFSYFSFFLAKNFNEMSPEPRKELKEIQYEGQSLLPWNGTNADRKLMQSLSPLVRSNFEARPSFWLSSIHVSTAKSLGMFCRLGSTIDTRPVTVPVTHRPWMRSMPRVRVIRPSFTIGVTHFDRRPCSRRYSKIRLGNGWSFWILAKISLLVL